MELLNADMLALESRLPVNSLQERSQEVLCRDKEAERRSVETQVPNAEEGKSDREICV